MVGGLSTIPPAVGIWLCRVRRSALTPEDLPTHDNSVLWWSNSCVCVGPRLVGLEGKPESLNHSGGSCKL